MVAVVVVVVVPPLSSVLQMIGERPRAVPNMIIGLNSVLIAVIANIAFSAYSAYSASSACIA